MSVLTYFNGVDQQDSLQTVSVLSQRKRTLEDDIHANVAKAPHVATLRMRHTFVQHYVLSSDKFQNIVMHEICLCSY